MPEAGSFTDWQQEERDSLLFVEKDFDWSDPPQRRRRRITEDPIRVHRRTAVIDHEPEPVDEYDDRIGPQQTAPVATGWDQPTVVHTHFDEMMQEWNTAYGSGAGHEDQARVERPFDLSDPGAPASAQAARRTVVITGHGDDRYLPAPRQRRSSELRFHERSSFSPDRAGLWAVLLSIALVIGAIVH